MGASGSTEVGGVEWEPEERNLPLSGIGINRRSGSGMEGMGTANGRAGTGFEGIEGVRRAGSRNGMNGT